MNGVSKDIVLKTGLRKIISKGQKTFSFCFCMSWKLWILVFWSCCVLLGCSRNKNDKTQASREVLSLCPSSYGICMLVYPKETPTSVLCLLLINIFCRFCTMSCYLTIHQMLCIFKPYSNLSRCGTYINFNHPHSLSSSYQYLFFRIRPCLKSLLTYS